MTTRLGEPTLIVIGGFAGTGKSTLARRLGRKLGVLAYEIDLMARAITDSRDYTGDNPKGVAFDIFWSFGPAHLKNGNSLIFDQNMGTPSQWDRVERIRTDTNARVMTFLLECPYEVCEERFYARTEHPDLDEVDLEDHRHKWDYINDNAFPGAIRIDANRHQDDVFNDVLAHFRTE